MMGVGSTLVLVVCLLSAATTAIPAENNRDIGRSRRLFPFIFNWGAPDCGRTCPLHHCSIDPAVIHGYCCGCAQLFDRVPVTCPYEIQCPLYPEYLCRDYNYMMDCCC